MAARLPGGNEQNLWQFVKQSTWDPVPVQRRIPGGLLPVVGPLAWVIDDVSMPKDGRMSVSRAPQYCGALDKRANCQEAPSVAALAAPLGHEAFVPLTWRQASKGELRSRFAAMRVRLAGKAVERPVKAVTSAEQGWRDGSCPTAGYWPNVLSAPKHQANTGSPASHPTPRSPI